MIRSAFSFCFYEQFQSFEVSAFPGAEWIQQLQSFAGGVYFYLYAAAICCRCLEAGVVYRKALGRQFITGRRIQFYALTLFID